MAILPVELIVVQEPEMRRLTVAATGSLLRTAVFMGRQHLVVPVIALREGVIHAVNASSPEFVPASELDVTPQGWNGRPVLPLHPVDAMRRQISANSPAVLEQHQFGFIANAHTEGRMLKMEAWLDRARALALGGDALRVIERLEAGKPIEVSVGAFVSAEAKDGTHEGRAYQAVWHAIVPDHLAMLPEGTLGACSNEMGCGAPRMMADGTLRDADNPEGINQYSHGVGQGSAGHSETRPEGAGKPGTKVEALRLSKVASEKSIQAYAHPSVATHTAAAHAHQAAQAAHDARGVIGSQHADWHWTKATEHSLALGNSYPPPPPSRRLLADGTLRDADNPEGINQYSGGGGKSADEHPYAVHVRKEVVSTHASLKEAKVAAKAANANRKVAAVVRSRGGKNNAYPAGTPHFVAKQYGTHAGRSAEEGTPPMTLRERVKALLRGARDEPTVAAEGDTAELVQYGTMQTLLDAVTTAYDAAVALLNDLVTEDATAPALPEDKAAVEELESARLESFQSYCMEMIGSISSAMQLAYKCTREDAPAMAVMAQKFKDLAGKRNSSSDQTMIQSVHDHTVKLGAACATLKANAGTPCGCGDSAAAAHSKGEDDMVEKATRIAALMACEHNTVKDKAILDALSTQELDVLEAFNKTRAAMAVDPKKVLADLVPKPEPKPVVVEKETVKQTDTKTVKELKPVDAPKTAEMSEDEYLKTAPESIRQLVADKKAADLVEKTALVTSLKDAQKEYGEAELQTMDLKTLGRLANVVKVVKPDFSGRGTPRTAETKSYAPPDGYAEGIKALRSVTR